MSRTLSGRVARWCALILLAFAGRASAGEIRHVILFLGDGMGAEHVRATEMWMGSALPFRLLPTAATITTHSANSRITDSAASGTAMATGRKVNNGVISQARPGNGATLTTLLEYYKGRGKRTGLVTTSHLTDATPATFAAHEASRGNYDNIAADYLNGSRPDVMLGGGGEGLTVAKAQAAGYHVVTTRAQLMALNAGSPRPVAGLFGSGLMPYEYDGLGALPHLADMLDQALVLLENSPQGFFLLVENEGIDQAAEANDLARCLPEVRELSRAVDHALAWAAGRTDTLIMVLADHETGGLKILANNGTGVLPAVTWSVRAHTTNPVPIRAWGTLAEGTFTARDNTDVHRVVSSAVPEWFSRTLNNDVLVWNDTLGLGGATAVPGDYNGDGEGDLAVYHAASGRWFIRTKERAVLAWGYGWGFADTLPVAGDFDGDGTGDLAVYHPAGGRWYIRSLDGRTLAWGLAWGYAGAKPVTGDFNGDGADDLALYDAAAGRWFIRTLAGSVLGWNVAWGSAALAPVAGDYNGDLRSDLALFDAARGRWYVRELAGNVLAWDVAWGPPGSLPVAGDYTGDGVADLMVFEGARGAWYGRSLGGAVFAWDVRWGYAGATPLPGDLNGDGQADLTVVRQP